MLLSAVYVLVVAQSISEIPEGLMNNPVYQNSYPKININVLIYRLSFQLKSIFFFPEALQPNAGYDILILEVF